MALIMGFSTIVISVGLVVALYPRYGADDLFVIFYYVLIFGAILFFIGIALEATTKKGLNL